MTGLRERFGRPLRLAIIGGGPDTWIGRMHRGAAEMDGWFRATAGVFSSDPARSRAAGAALGFDPARSYGDVAEMLAQERERPDRIDAVAIMTPNDTHYPYAAAALDAGLDVVCDKPVTHDFAQACDLVARTRDARQDLRDRARVRRVSDDPLRPAARARRRARHPSPGAGRVHPERSRHAPRGRAAEQPPALAARSCAQRAGAGDERDRLPRAASRGLRVRAFRRARRRRRRRAAARPQGGGSRVRADRVRGRRARHVHRHPGRRRRRERHPSARLRREGHARLVASRAELPEARAARASRPAPSGGAIRSCRPRSSPPAARRAAIPRDCARRSPTSTRKSRRNGWRASWAKRFPICPIRASRRARTRWRSSRPAWRRRRGERGSTWRRRRRAEPRCRSPAACERTARARRSRGRRRAGARYFVSPGSQSEIAGM